MADADAMHVTVRLVIDISPEMLRQEDDFVRECREILTRPWYRRSPIRLAALLSRACDWLCELARHARVECR